MFESMHLNGDIAFAVRQYYYLTQDKTWLKDVGFPIVNGTASFYAARLVEREGEEGTWDFAEVMGPDEYSFPVLNSAYTNYVAKVALSFAAFAAEELGYTGEVYTSFAEQAEGIYIPMSSDVPGRPELTGGYHPEYEGFPEGSPGKLFYKPSPPCDASDGCVKQADTILLGFPLGMEMEAEVLSNNLDFYEPVTDPNGPAMTWSMFAIGWIAAGNYERSAKMFPRGYANVHQPFGVWSEYPADFDNPGAINFITGAGGFLQSVVFGTSGLRVHRDRLTFDPPPPSATGTAATRMIVHSLHYLGARLRQEVDNASMRFQLLSAAPDGRTLCLVRKGHGEKELVVGKAVGCPRGQAEIRPCTESQSSEEARLV
jgi:trehalose/maltose hydrolase-like predicted phosphorylase